MISLAVDKLPRSYRHLVLDEVFLDDNGVNLAPEIFRERYTNLFIDIQALLKKYNLIDYCTVNKELLWKAVLDYFEDMARLKIFHGYEHSQTDKIFSYETYWLLRNHPIQIDKPDDIDEKYVHVNEYIFSFFLIRKLAQSLDLKLAPNIQIDDLVEKMEEHELIDEFRKKLYYTFKFRTFTPQSLLLVIEGFMTAAEFILQAT